MRHRLFKTFGGAVFENKATNSDVSLIGERIFRTCLACYFVHWYNIFILRIWNNKREILLVISSRVENIPKLLSFPPFVRHLRE